MRSKGGAFEGSMTGATKPPLLNIPEIKITKKQSSAQHNESDKARKDSQDFSDKEVVGPEHNGSINAGTQFDDIASQSLVRPMGEIEQSLPHVEMVPDCQLANVHQIQFDITVNPRRSLDVKDLEPLFESVLKQNFDDKRSEGRKNKIIAAAFDIDVDDVNDPDINQEFGQEDGEDCQGQEYVSNQYHQTKSMNTAQPYLFRGKSYVFGQ